MGEPLPIHTLEPDDGEREAQLPPPAVQETRQIVKLTAAQRRKLLKDAGMVSLDLNQLEAVAEIGEFVSQLGLYHIGAAKLAALQSDIEVIYAKTVDLASKHPDDKELQVQLCGIQETLNQQRLDAIKLDFTAAKEMPNKRGNNGGVNSPIPFPPNVAIQFNVNGNQADASLKS